MKKIKMTRILDSKKKKKGERESEGRGKRGNTGEWAYL